MRRYVEWENVDSFRRERIYSFRPRSGITPPNYLTKGQVIRISSQIHKKNIRKSGFADGMSKPIPKGVYGPFPVQQTMGGNRPFGRSESVPYANTGKCTIQRTTQKSLPIGTHKYVPYENSVNVKIADKQIFYFSFTASRTWAMETPCSLASLARSSYSGLQRSTP